MSQEGNRRYRHSRLTQTHIVSNEDADICVFRRSRCKAMTNYGVEACELVPMKVQWNDVGIAVGIVKEGWFVPHHKACLMSETVKKEGEAIHETQLVSELIRAQTRLIVNAQAL